MAELRKFSNGLTPAEDERLAILIEEMGEALQAAGKIMRHGYESYNPVIDTGTTNRRELERELGHVSYMIGLMCSERDVNTQGVTDSIDSKAKSIVKWLHHQGSTNGK